MKSIVMNNLGYTGIVTLSQYIGKTKAEIKKVYNSGGVSLFSFLADCITGDFELAKKTRPTKIMLLSMNENSKELMPVSGFIYMWSVPEKVSVGGTETAVQYSFMVQRELLEADFTHIGLYADSATYSDITKYSAICQVGETAGKIASLSASTALVVDWKLIISNRDKALQEVPTAE